MIETLAKRIRQHEKELEHWLGALHAKCLPPVYASVDIRNSGNKIAVVDSNLFPSGFNNLCETFAKEASAQFQHYFETYHPGVRRLLLIPEDHTRNRYYFEHLLALSKILTHAGYELAIGSTRAELIGPQKIPLPEGEQELSIEPIALEKGFLKTARFTPDLILLNNDLSEGFPSYLKNLHQPVVPSPKLGWHSRKKSEHFKLIHGLIDQVATLLEIDPWLLQPLTTVETDCNVDDPICLQRLADTVNRFLMRLRQKHLEYQIAQEPYVFIKNNSGTYGMAVTSVFSGDEVLKWGRRVRNKMKSAKSGSEVNEYLIQEGIPTADFYEGRPFEPVVYQVGGEPIGIFFRINEQRDRFENLNSKGMTFTCRCFHKLSPAPGYQLTYQDKSDLFLISTWLARISSAALGLEHCDQLKKTL